MNPMNYSSFSYSYRRKHRCSATVAYAAIRRMFMTHNKYNTYSINNSSLMDDQVSARKLAARLWHLRFMDEVSRDGSHYQGDNNGSVDIRFPHYQNYREKVNMRKGLLRRPITMLRSRNGAGCEIGSVGSDPTLAEASSDSPKNHRKKILEEKMLVGFHNSLVTTLLNQLLQAQRSINMLKAAHKSSKKRAEQLFQDLEEEKFHWKHREYKKIQPMLDNLKYKLSRESKRKEKMELVNTRLLHELGEAKFYAKQFMTNYEKEKKERELTEEVCNQLVMQIEEDKAKIEGLLCVSLKLCEEVEEERNMMQMVNQWREERVRMKLADAKLVLEDKYNQMVQLIGYLEMFLTSRSAELSTIFKSMNIQQVVELPHDFSMFEEIFPISENIRKDNVEHILGNEAECSEKLGMKSLKTHSKCRPYSASKLLRLCPNVGTSSSNAKASQYRGQGKVSIEGSFRHKELPTQGNSRDTMNPHIARGMKGCIEWPRGTTPKENSKVIPLEEIVRSQKSQLQNILKGKAEGSVR